MADMYLIHAQAVYDHALANYTKEGWDCIVECHTVPEMAKELAGDNIRTKAAAIRYFKSIANFFDEQRKNCY
jgi:hypothetical protein